MPKPLTRQAGRCGRPEIVGDPLQRNQMIVVVEAGHDRVGQQANLRHACQLGNDPGGPVRAVMIADTVSAAQQRAAPRRVAVGQDHPRAAAPGGKRRGQPGRPAADNQHVAMRVALVVARRVGVRGCVAEPGHMAQQRLPQRHPQPARL